jgi:hypothetical protein
MLDRERELERELRELGALIYYPPTPDVAHTARTLLDEEADRPRRSFPTLRWAAVAAAFVLVVAVPTLSPSLRTTISDWFVAGGTKSAGEPAVDAGSSERESKANAPASDISKGDEAVTFPSRAPSFTGARITLPEARTRMEGALLLPRTPKLGKPDEIYTIRASREDGVVLVYREGLPPLADTGLSLVLTEVPGEVEPAYLTGKGAVESEPERVMVDEHPGYWIPAGSLPFGMGRHLPGNVLLWEQGGVALRLEANLQKEQAVRIAESGR